LPLFLVSVAARGLAALGMPASTPAVLQGLNAVLAAAGVLLFFEVLALLATDVLLPISGALLLATSFGYWYFANGEIHYWGIVVLLAIFLLTLRATWRGGPQGYTLVVALGLLTAVAVAFHQENFLFGFVPVAMLLAGRPGAAPVKQAAVYTIAGSLGTAGLALAIGVLLRGVTTVEEFIRWYFWPFFKQLQPYEQGGILGTVSRSVKAQLTAFVAGTQVLADAAKEPTLLAHPKVIALGVMTLAVYALAAILLVQLWRRRPARDERRVALIGGVAWLLSYKLVLHSWFEVPSTKLHVVTLPPIILLLLLGPIAANAGRTVGSRADRLQSAAVVTLLVLVVGTNVGAGIVPWIRYGHMKEALALRVEAAFRADDLFISSESGADSVFHVRGRALPLKDLFKTASDDGFRVVSRAIRAQLDKGGRVFLYNFVPNNFTLYGIRRVAGKDSEPLTRRDFEEFVTVLRKCYRFVPVLSYWEESKMPLYLYGERLETLWELRAIESTWRC
jgi:hypothetical protein